MKDASKLTESELRNLIGTENWYRHPLNRYVLFSDGAKHVADHGGAYWLLDIIACAQRYDQRVAAEPFQVWRLSVHQDETAVISCEDGNLNPVPRWTPENRPYVDTSKPANEVAELRTSFVIPRGV
jgi:hypothetical protein